MEIKGIGNFLEDIRNKYDNVRQMTETIDSNSIEGCRMLIEERGRLLTEIVAQERFLDRRFHGWRDLCAINENLAGICNDIQRNITAALTLDSILQEKLHTRMEKTKKEIATLSKRTRAAVSYTRQKR